jgi:hypothetical protein
VIEHGSLLLPANTVHDALPNGEMEGEAKNEWGMKQWKALGQRQMKYCKQREKQDPSKDIFAPKFRT